jgi:hypothetical protein
MFFIVCFRPLILSRSCTKLASCNYHDITNIYEDTNFEYFVDQLMISNITPSSCKKRCSLCMYKVLCLYSTYCAYKHAFFVALQLRYIYASGIHGGTFPRHFHSDRIQKFTPPDKLFQALCDSASSPLTLGETAA